MNYFGTPPWLGYRLWSYHVDSFLEDAGGLLLTVLSYDRFFSKNAGEEMDRLSAFVDKSAAQGREVLSSVLRRDERHHSPREVDLPPRVSRLYARVLTLHEGHCRPTTCRGID